MCHCNSARIFNYVMYSTILTQHSANLSHTINGNDCLESFEKFRLNHVLYFLKIFLKIELLVKICEK